MIGIWVGVGVGVGKGESGGGVEDWNISKLTYEKVSCYCFYRWCRCDLVIEWTGVECWERGV